VKTIKTIFILLFCTGSSTAQTVQLDNFNAYRAGENVLLKWTISSGSTCNGIQIFRSEDTVTFIQIGDIQGVCGSSSSPTPYEFTDANPLTNKINYYKLQLGGTGFSVTISLHFILFSSSNYLITPSPVTGMSEFYFSNSLQEEHFFKLYDAAGRLVKEQNNITGDKFIFDKDFLLPGIYFFSLATSENIRVKGKILVL